jgi:hypothetical protein
MRRILLAGLGLLLDALPLGAARADWEYAKWGMTPAQLVAASHGAVSLYPPAQRMRVEELKLDYLATGEFADGPLHLLVNFAFDIESGGLALVTYVVADTAQNGVLQAWLARKYGPPQTTGGVPMIGLKTYGWRGGDEIDLNISTGERAVVIQTPKGRS